MLKKSALLTVLVAIAGSSLIGCSSGNPPATKEEANNFAHPPMTPPAGIHMGPPPTTPNPSGK